MHQGRHDAVVIEAHVKDDAGYCNRMGDIGFA